MCLFWFPHALKHVCAYYAGPPWAVLLASLEIFCTWPCVLAPTHILSWARLRSVPSSCQWSFQSPSDHVSIVFTGKLARVEMNAMGKGNAV